MSSFLPDFKYSDLIRGKHVRRDRLVNVRFPPLKTVARTFFDNLARTDSFCLFPAVIAFEALRDQLWWDRAVLKATGKLPPLCNARFSEKTKKAIDKELLRIINADRKRSLSGSDKISYLRMGAKHIQGMATHELGAGQSLEALLFSVVVESWMAFETFAADLFYTALDHGPAEWRIRVGNKSKEFRGGSNWEPQRVVPSNIHDPQSQYGSFLRDMAAISFQRFREIKFWYRTAFGNEAEKLFRVVEGGYIRALSAVRNVILHQGGKADATYISEIGKFPELSEAEENKLIQLNGPTVRKLRNAAIALGVELFSYVEDAIRSQNKPKP